MIYIKDNFLPDIILNKMEEYLVDFKEIDTEHKKFWVMEAEEPFIKYIKGEISNLEGNTIENILSFFRIATDELDTDWRIHCDSIINEQLPDRALVLYMNDSEFTCMNGTAFWKHKIHGDSLPVGNLSTKEYNNLILNEAEDLSKWTLSTIIGHKKNRLLSYPCNYFHSKYPNIAWKSGRKIFVMFYKVN
tara:strand:+ start:121 stop:690 length:570 start_codon:yes stop_codon:yes gene_type:complete